VSSGLSPESGASNDHLPAARKLRTAGEVVVCLLASVVVWGFAGNDPIWEFGATIGVCLLMMCWFAHTLVTKRFTFRMDLATVCLSSLILFSAIQLVPLPLGLVKFISPTAAELHSSLRPETGELLPGESVSTPRSNSLTLSVNPYATKQFAGQVLAILLVYAAVRNWLASRESFRRFAWVCTFTGLALSVIAFGQYFSGSRDTLYWTFKEDGAVFGPFICRNHYTDFIALCAGMALALILQERNETSPESTSGLKLWDRIQLLLAAPGQLLSEPRTLIPTLAFGLMLISIPFSLSRGGLLALIIAAPATWLLTRRLSSNKDKERTAKSNQLQWGVILSVTIAIAFGAWFGWAPIENRISSKQPDSRTDMWLTGLSVVPGYWLTGSGSGTYRWVEPLGRTTEDPRIYHEHAHNEYLEALVEGGPLRLIVTLVLAGSLLWTIARGYRQRRDRSMGPLLLGGWLGILVVVLHASVDFGIHMPAVALLTAIVAAYSVAAATDPDYSATKHRRGRRRTRAEASEIEAYAAIPIHTAAVSNSESVAVESTSRRRSKRKHSSEVADETGTTYQGGMAIALTALATIAAFTLLLDARNRQSADWYRRAANVIAGEIGPERHINRIPYLEARTIVRPGDPAGHVELARAHLAAANDLTLTSTASICGIAITQDLPANKYPKEIIAQHIVPALRALRTARDLCPVYPEAQANLSEYGRFFTKSDPKLLYLERALRLLPSDGAIWTDAGSEAWHAGNQAKAVTSWKRALETSPAQMVPVLQAIGRKMTPEDLRKRILPDHDPVIFLDAANRIYPDRERQAAQRQPFLLGAYECRNQPKLTSEQYIAIAQACAELDLPADASLAFQNAIKLTPERLEWHGQYADWLEREEMYEEAVQQLEWLRNNFPSRNNNLQDRIIAAKHGAKLQRDIRGQ